MVAYCFACSTVSILASVLGLAPGAFGGTSSPSFTRVVIVEKLRSVVHVDVRRNHNYLYESDTKSDSDFWKAPVNFTVSKWLSLYS